MSNFVVFSLLYVLIAGYFFFAAVSWRPKAIAGSPVHEVGFQLAFGLGFLSLVLFLFQSGL